MAAAAGGIITSGCATHPAPINPEQITINGNYSSARSSLEQHGYTHEPRCYDVDAAPDIKIDYYTISKNTAVQVTHHTPSDTIRAIHIITSPQYQPVKGLNVLIPVNTVTINNDDSLSFKLPKPAAAK